MFDRQAKQQNAHKTATCKECDSTRVAWRKSEKTGRWYLVEVFTIDGADKTSKTWLHSEFCTKGAKKSRLDHAAIQREWDGGVKAEPDTDDEAEDFTAAKLLLSILDLSDDDKRLRLAILEVDESRFQRNPPTMDDFAEFQQATAEAKRRQNEIAFLRAALHTT